MYHPQQATFSQPRHLPPINASVAAPWPASAWQTLTYSSPGFPASLSKDVEKAIDQRLNMAMGEGAASQEVGFLSQPVMLSTPEQTAEGWSSYQGTKVQVNSQQTSFLPNMLHQTNTLPAPAALGSTDSLSDPMSSWSSSCLQMPQTSDNIASVLASFGLSSEDLEVISHFPSDQLTPETLPFILQDIQRQKASQPQLASLQPSPASQPDPPQPAAAPSTPVTAFMNVMTQASATVFDYGHTSQDGYTREALSRKQSPNFKFKSIHDNVPTPNMISDYLACVPSVYPHTCSLCKVQCDKPQDWQDHVDAAFHFNSCSAFRKKYPDWRPAASHHSRQRNGSSPCQDRWPRRHGTHSPSRSVSRSLSSGSSPERSSRSQYTTHSHHGHHSSGKHSFSYKRAKCGLSKTRQASDDLSSRHSFSEGLKQSTSSSSPPSSSYLKNNKRPQSHSPERHSSRESCSSSSQGPLSSSSKFGSMLKATVTLDSKPESSDKNLPMGTLPTESKVKIETDERGFVLICGLPESGDVEGAINKLAALHGVPAEVIIASEQRKAVVVFPSADTAREMVKVPATINDCEVSVEQLSISVDLRKLVTLFHVLMGPDKPCGALTAWNRLLVVSNVPDTPAGVMAVQKLVQDFGSVTRTLVLNHNRIIFEMETAENAHNVCERFQKFPCIIHNHPLHFLVKPDSLNTVKKSKGTTSDQEDSYLVDAHMDTVAQEQNKKMQVDLCLEGEGGRKSVAVNVSSKPEAKITSEKEMAFDLPQITPKLLEALLQECRSRSKMRLATGKEEEVRHLSTSKCSQSEGTSLAGTCKADKEGVEGNQEAGQGPSKSFSFVPERNGKLSKRGKDEETERITQYVKMQEEIAPFHPSLEMDLDEFVTVDEIGDVSEGPDQSFQETASSPAEEFSNNERQPATGSHQATMNLDEEQKNSFRELERREHKNPENADRQEVDENETKNIMAVARTDGWEADMQRQCHVQNITSGTADEGHCIAAGNTATCPVQGLLTAPSLMVVKEVGDGDSNMDREGQRQTDTTGTSLVKGVSRQTTRRKSQYEEEESLRKRIRPDLSFPEAYSLPPFSPVSPIGMELLEPRTGFFCQVCVEFCCGGLEAKRIHCCSLKHYQNMQRSLHQWKTNGSRSSQGIG
ncbi:uncharacterized protein LOC114789355 isoform X2 [Denticeps clupeoides]|nr:uncharacterized protein LOC114789355 isoform X2 [Denticeps clupeoides]